MGNERKCISQTIVGSQDICTVRSVIIIYFLKHCQFSRYIVRSVGNYQFHKPVGSQDMHYIL
jgi:hypothetical protein